MVESILIRIMDNSSNSRSLNEVEAALVAKESGSSTTKTKSGGIPTPTYFAFWSTDPTYYPILSHSFICSIILFLSATGTLPIVQTIIQPFLSTLSLLLLRITFILTAVVSFLHQSGALRRYVLKFAEDEISKNLNGALITLSDGQIDLLRGKVIAQDLIIHNKDRDDWEWDSPCLARVGRIEATLNFASVIQLPYIGRILNHTFFDVYTVLVEDVQVFIEKRKNIFNFHLLDASLDIPDHNLIMEEYNKVKKRKQEQLGVSGGSKSISEEMSISKSASLEDGNRVEEERGDLVGTREEGAPIRSEREDEANKIVEKLVGAVSKIGKAANEGGSKGLQSILMTEKSGLVQNLKELHKQKSMRGKSSKSSEARKESWKTKKKHGVSVMRELGKVVEKNVTDIKNQVAFLQKPPEKKEGWVTRTPDDIRIGSILLREARVFTKDVLVAKGGGKSDDAAVNATFVSASERSSGRSGASKSDSNIYDWAKPIVIFELAVTGAELCPPMSARDPRTGMPVVAISIDRLVDILLKRIMGEAAKSNTGRLFGTAFGDVFSFVGDNVSSSREK